MWVKVITGAATYVGFLIKLERSCGYGAYGVVLATSDDNLTFLRNVASGDISFLQGYDSEGMDVAVAKSLDYWGFKTWDYFSDEEAKNDGQT